MIDKKSPLPIYYQLEEKIRHLINSEQLKPGELLPSEREYAEKYDISRMTVRQAINNLASDGLLIRLKGKGTFVAEKKFEQSLQGLTGFSEDMRTRGLEPSNRMLSFKEQQADEKVASKLNIAPKDPIYVIQRIRLANDAPVALETNYVPKDLVGDLTEEDVNLSFYDYIEKKLDLKITHGDQVMEAVLANEFEINYLGINKGDPILLIQRQTYLSNDVPFEYVTSSYRADKYALKLRMPRIN
ncbi:GntR family transcriptional regulator [Aquibacillus sp. 3ASR75-11]|uniref:GntR family transcriptional regulator n=1 Tax=Terrihalobacillus insolitus TaxID=2950438 RepID=A0A9X3WNM5_9BACI|nr:GntR family transcriptional regulator [Terrihalobacillus insolitus]MDC3412214.1 GntR family transcriptional regulator [Terrihalobacillus insolitus]MDC3423092.1 GntR family transcriptional regulator [Terrihalobacillus insolitus]